MSRLGWTLSLVALCAGASAPAQDPWSYVPATGGARAVRPFVEPYVPTEAVVRVVATPVVPAPPAAEIRGVVTFGVSESPGTHGGGQISQLVPRDEVPPNAHWPDMDGRIAAVAPQSGGGTAVSGLRNPWDIRVRAKAVGNEPTFTCSGIISGGAGGPVAILNGRLAKRGDASGAFHVARILAAAVLLEHGGVYFVVPYGRRITVETVDK